MLIPGVNPSAVIKAHFSSFNVFLSYLFQEKFNNGKQQQQQQKKGILLRTCYCVISQTVSQASSFRGAPSTWQVPARDYSVTFQQEPRSFEIRKDKQHKMRQRGSPGTLERREFSYVLSLVIIQNQSNIVLNGNLTNKVVILPTAYFSTLPPQTYQF